MIVRISDEAERDLETIGDWIARDDPARALSFVQEIREACVELSEFPERFALVPRYEDRGVRHRVHGNFLIFYRVEPEQVVIAHILHGAMDYAGLIFPG